MRKSSVHHTPPARCPRCLEQLDAAGPHDPRWKAPPRPGDFTVCLYCASVLRYTETMGLVRLTPADIARLPGAEREDVLNAQRAVQWFICLDPPQRVN
jgi:hypothetical protein